MILVALFDGTPRCSRSRESGLEACEQQHLLDLTSGYSVVDRRTDEVSAVLMSRSKQHDCA
jgi:hypothetical protein